ncbi:putative mitochondrial protein [Vitis vinifera]|uniref:Putative mitochondrial protein n=1 Tax=Vitis vinifera TaxID=29760 RepID=A0A438HBS8_VITVI|nr:putative mitochondrial protein [Vitis vinifera]
MQSREGPRSPLGDSQEGIEGLVPSHQHCVGGPRSVEKAQTHWNVREYVKEFSSLMLDIKNMSEEDKLFNFMSGLQGWAQKELWRQGVRDLPAAMVAADCWWTTRWVVPSPLRRDPRGKQWRRPLSSCSRPLGWLDVSSAMALIELETAPKGRNSQPCDCKRQGRLTRRLLQDGEWCASEGFSGTVVPLTISWPLEKQPGWDLNWRRTPVGSRQSTAKPKRSKGLPLKGQGALIPHLGGLVVLEEKQPCFVKALRTKDGALIEIKEGQSMEVPNSVVKILKEFKDVMPAELPKEVAGVTEATEGVAGCRSDLALQSPIWCTSAVPKETGWLTPHVCGLQSPQQGDHQEQVRIAAGDEGKTTCVTRYGSYEFLALCEAEKCEFAQEEITFLGHKISAGLIRMDKGKVQAIMEWTVPTKVTELRSFLGLANYYRRFIKGYSKRVSPLTDPLKKDNSWDWSMQCQMAFEGLKEAISTEPVLRLQNWTYPLKSKQMPLIEPWVESWCRKGTLWLVETLLVGSIFTVVTDNVANTFFKTQKKLSPRQRDGRSSWPTSNSSGYIDQQGINCG